MLLRINEGLVKLRDEPRIDSPNTHGTLTKDDLLEQIGAADTAGWVRVRLATRGKPPHEGFIRETLLEEAPAPPIVANIDKGQFLNQLTVSARVFGTNNLYLYALAHMESNGVRNVKSKSSSAFGPFQFMPDTWEHLVQKHGPATGVAKADIIDPGMQAIIAAASIAEQQRAVTAALGRVPSGAELYLTHLFGQAAALHVLRADRSEPIDAPLRRFYKGTAKGEGFAEVILTANSSLLRPTLGKSSSVEEVLVEVVKRFEPGLVEAEAVARSIGLVPDSLPGDPGEVPPWMTVAQAELAKGVVENPAAGGSNPDIDKYFTATSMGTATDDTPWCAAFVSWCMANSGNAKVKFANLKSVRAADWLSWGFSTGRPVLGCVVVTEELVAGSSGHVGFCTGVNNGRVRLLAGNQKDSAGNESVCERDFLITSIRDYRWVYWK